MYLYPGSDYCSWERPGAEQPVGCLHIMTCHFRSSGEFKARVHLVYLVQALQPTELEAVKRDRNELHSTDDVDE